MADFRLGRLKFNWKGNWAVSTAYVIDDIVKYGAYTYVCTTNHTSTTNENTFYSADVAKWSLHTEGIVNKGNWVASTWYKIGDVVIPAAKKGEVIIKTINFKPRSRITEKCN